MIVQLCPEGVNLQIKRHNSEYLLESTQKHTTNVPELSACYIGVLQGIRTEFITGSKQEQDMLKLMTSNTLMKHGMFQWRRGRTLGLRKQRTSHTSPPEWEIP